MAHIYDAVEEHVRLFLMRNRDRAFKIQNSLLPHTLRCNPLPVVPNPSVLLPPLKTPESVSICCVRSFCQESGCHTNHFYLAGNSNISTAPLHDSNSAPLHKSTTNIWHNNMTPQSSIIASNFQNRLSVSFITTTDFCMLHDCRRFRVQQYQGLSIA